MNIPENGRVVVIDDAIEEALPLLRILTKDKKPVLYFTGNREDRVNAILS